MIDEAVRWMSRMRAGTDADRRAFRAWLDERPEHIAAMDLVERAWRTAPEAAQRARLAPPPRAQTRFTAPRWTVPAMASAAFAALLVLVWTGTVHEQVVVAPVNDTRRAVLDDGTRIWLAAGGRIAMRSTLLARDVTLDGEAVFDVRHDRRPFAVTAGAIRVVDRGTVFSVDRRSGGTKIVLARGSIAVEDRASGETIATPRPGQEVDVRSGEATLSPVDADAALAWRDGRIVARDMPLAAVAQRFGELGGPPIRIVDPAIGAIRVYGIYRVGQAEQFLDAIAALHPVMWQRVEDGYEVRARR